MLDALAAPEDVLGRVHEPEAEAPLAEQLLHQGRGLWQLGHRQRVVDVGRLAIAVGVGRGVLVGVEAEAAVEPSRQDSVEALLGVAPVALLQQRGDRRQVRLAVDPGQASALRVGVEEVVAGAAVGDQPDDHQGEQQDPAGDRGADPESGRGADRNQRDRRGPEPADQGRRVAEQVAQVDAAGVIGVVGDRRQVRLR
ncbi:MAG: hypothetical protein ABWZ43_02355 [Solirubrobacterales bacterium]